MLEIHGDRYYHLLFSSNMTNELDQHLGNVSLILQRKRIIVISELLPIFLPQLPPPFRRLAYMNVNFNF